MENLDQRDPGIEEDLNGQFSMFTTLFQIGEYEKAQEVIAKLELVEGRLRMTPGNYKHLADLVDFQMSDMERFRPKEGKLDSCRNTKKTLYGLGEILQTYLVNRNWAKGNLIIARQNRDMAETYARLAGKELPVFEVSLD